MTLTIKSWLVIVLIVAIIFAIAVQHVHGKFTIQKTLMSEYRCLLNIFIDYLQGPATLTKMENNIALSQDVLYRQIKTVNNMKYAQDDE